MWLQFFIKDICRPYFNKIISPLIRACALKQGFWTLIVCLIKSTLSPLATQKVTKLMAEIRCLIDLMVEGKNIAFLPVDV